MSLPIAELLKGLGLEGKAPNEGPLKNPDIPERGLSASNIKATRDRYYNSMRLNSHPRNGSGYSIARGPGITNMDPRRQEFLLEGSIDPANIRARHNPLKAPPNSYAEGSEGFQYQLGASTRTSNSAISLMQRARQSYANRLNRLQPISVPVSVQNPEFSNLLKPGAISVGGAL